MRKRAAQRPRRRWIAAAIALSLAAGAIAAALGSGGLDPHEVTNAQYARFVAVTGREPPPHWPHGRPPPGRDDEPVVMVTWYDAAAYCAWDDHKRLPTAAEWQAACQAGGLVKRGNVWEWTMSVAAGTDDGKILCGPQGSCACGHVYDPSWRNMVKGFRCTGSQPLAWHPPRHRPGR
jgi:formylglycine-generating enzyme required for sulfatase activity